VPRALVMRKCSVGDLRPVEYKIPGPQSQLYQISTLPQHQRYYHDEHDSKAQNV
jgi:hypothetical protein